MKRTTKRLWLAALCVLVMGVPFAASVEPELRQVTLGKITGEVMLRIGGGEWVPANANAVMHALDEIRTGKDSTVEIFMDNRETGKLHLKENSYLRLTTMTVSEFTGDKTTLLDLALGRVLVHAEKLKGNSKFEVRTPTSTTGVRGTVFEVSVENKD